MEPSQKPIVLFSPFFEYSNLFLPLFFLILVAFDLSGAFSLTQFDRRAGFFISDVVFLNQIHVIFSLAMLLITPEFKSWLGAEEERQKFFLLRSFGVMLFVFLVLMDWIPFFSFRSMDPILLRLGVQLFVVAQIHHGVSQSLGLSLAYNSKARSESGGALSPRIRLAEVWERRLAKTLIHTNAAFVLARVLFPEFAKLVNINFAISCALVGAIIGTGFLYPAGYRNKRLFMMRYLIFPFGPFSFLALLCSAAVHGYEYLGVFWKMQSSSVDQNKPMKTRIILASSGVVAVYGCVAILGGGAHGFGSLTEYPMARAILWAFSLSFTFWHYHVDAFLFRMKDPSTRKFLGPLLIRSKAA